MAGTKAHKETTIEDTPEGAVVPEPVVEATKAELTEQARELGIEGRSSMDKETLHDSVLEEVARRVLAGEYGDISERRLRLAQAGYDVNKVQAAVIRLLNNRNK